MVYAGGDFGLVDTRDDEDSRYAASVDSGRIVFRMPRAVAAPMSAQDVVEVVRWANRTGSSLALRGKGHTQAGQSLTLGGVQIDMQGLDRIGPMDKRRWTLRVQAGATWRGVVGCLGRRGWMPIVLTNNLDTTVCGTLSTRGVGLSSHLYSTQANNVDELEAVTGDGRLLRCSSTENTSLFDATRAGLGQFSVITEARIRIRRVLGRVRMFRLVYEDLAALMRDLAQILSDRRFNYLHAWCQHRDERFIVENGDWSHRLDVSVGFDTEPDEAELLAGLQRGRPVRTTDWGIAEFAGLPVPKPLPARRHATLCFPATEGYLPWPTVALCVSRVFETLSRTLLKSTTIILRPLGVGPTPVLMFPRSRSVQGFGLLPYVPVAALQSVLPVIEDAGRLLVAAGGNRYLRGWARRRRDEWQAHYGRLWTTVLRWNGPFDPNGVFSNGFIRYGLGS